MERLWKIIEELLGPNGCRWDLAQTLETLQKHLIEEAHEVVEAIDEKAPEKIKEELGDLLFVLVFMAKRAEKDGLFAFPEVIGALCQKLVRRHPHVFGKKENLTPEMVLERWQQIKQEEKKAALQASSPLGGIPPTLPLLRQMQMAVKKIKKAGLDLSEAEKISEQELFERIFALVKRSEASGISLEDSLRRALKAFLKEKDCELKRSEQEPNQD
ncbi:MAG: MazG nucleotide pyrophosphohydrolase domain-containing protein [Parachlamydiales bacterium]|jgi:MazG family protein